MGEFGESEKIKSPVADAAGIMLCLSFGRHERHQRIPFL
jgi:hypothetical protein